MTEPVFHTLWQALDSHCCTDAGKAAFIFLGDGETETDRLTYGALGDRVKQVAKCMTLFCRPGDRALLLYPPGLEFIVAFFACLHAGVVAVPVYPPDPGNPGQSAQRLGRIARDAGTALVLTSAAAMDLFQGLLAPDALFAALDWLATDTLDVPEGPENCPEAIAPDTLAFLQYTSGSTGHPKGVRICHANIVANARAAASSIGLSGNSRFVSWLPYYHDMGLVGKILFPVFLGASCVLMPPRSFLERPERWLSAISRYRGSISAAPNFAYDLCVKKVSETEIQGLDLRSWTCACNGSEPVSPPTLGRFANRFGSCGFESSAFFPCYGMAEATLIVSGPNPLTQPRLIHLEKEALQANRVLESGHVGTGTVTLVGCGAPCQDHEIRIVDPVNRTLNPAGRVGEIWISGPSISNGYWNTGPDANKAFHGRIPGRNHNSYFCTGDLGFIKDNQLFITGRRKDVIVIRGKNHYPQDIEATIQACHELLKPGGCAAFGLERQNKTILAVVAEVMDGTLHHRAAEAIFRCMGQAVARDHGVRLHEAALIAPGTLLKTSSGKVRRSACRQAYQARQLTALALLPDQALPESAFCHSAILERLVQAQDPEVLDVLMALYLQETAAGLLEVLPATVNVDDPLHELGFDSLMFFEFLGLIQEGLSCEIEVDKTFLEMSLSGLSRRLVRLRAEIQGVRPHLSG